MTTIQHPHNRLVNVQYLRKCDLWHGSMEEQNFQHGGLKLGQVLEKIKAYEKCDDLTPKEEQYLAALRKTAEIKVV